MNALTPISADHDRDEPRPDWDYCPCGRLIELCNSPRCEHFDWGDPADHNRPARITLHASLIPPGIDLGDERAVILGLLAAGACSAGFSDCLEQVIEAARIERAAVEACNA